MVLTQTTLLRAYGEGALWTHFILVVQHRLHFQHCPRPWVGGVSLCSEQPEQPYPGRVKKDGAGKGHCQGQG